MGSLRPINFWKWGPGIHSNVQSEWRITHIGKKSNLNLSLRFILSFNSLRPSSLVMRKMLQLYSVYICYVDLCNWPFLIKGFFVFLCRLAYTFTFSIRHWLILQKSKMLTLDTLSLICLHHFLSAGINNNMLYGLHGGLWLTMYF